MKIKCQHCSEIECSDCPIKVLCHFTLLLDFIAWLIERLQKDTWDLGSCIQYTWKTVNPKGAR